MTSKPLRPVADLAGSAPVPAAIAELDWGGSPAEASVGRLLEAVHAWDRMAVQVVESLVLVVESGATDQALGVAVELVLSQSARMVRFERTTLLRVATTLVAMPAVRQAFREGWISFSHVKAIVTAVRRVPVTDRDQVDDLVGRIAHEHRDHEADAVVHEVDWLVDHLVATHLQDREVQPIEVNRTRLTPRLDGSGTSFTEWDADHFPLFVQAIDNAADERHPFEAEPDPDDLPDEADDADLTDAHRRAWEVRGRNASRRAKALFELVTARDHDTLAPLADGLGSSGRPSVSITCSVDALLDGTAPAWVLNRLGGRISVTAATARRWLDVAGADARLFLFDECGEVVGYGRRQRHARGWLRDAIIARDLHDTAPCSTTPAAFCDVDHVRDWEAGGPTDAPNLGLLSRRWHTAKTDGHWRLTRHPDGTRAWTQTRSGYTISQPRPPHLGTPTTSTHDRAEQHGPSP